MINPISILEGAGNYIFGFNQSMSEARLKICMRCPIYSSAFGGMCNKKLYLDPKTGDVSIDKRDGYIQGCGCSLKLKTTVASEECPAGKW
jgi:hypothetical protein